MSSPISHVTPATYRGSDENPLDSLLRAADELEQNSLDPVSELARPGTPKSGSGSGTGRMRGIPALRVIPNTSPYSRDPPPHAGSNAARVPSLFTLKWEPSMGRWKQLIVVVSPAKDAKPCTANRAYHFFYDQSIHDLSAFWRRMEMVFSPAAHPADRKVATLEYLVQQGPIVGLDLRYMLTNPNQVQIRTDMVEVMRKAYGESMRTIGLAGGKVKIDRIPQTDTDPIPSVIVITRERNEAVES